MHCPHSGGVAWWSGHGRLLDLVHDAITVRELNSGAVVYWNRGAEALYGLARADVENSVLDEVIATRYPSPRDEIVATLIRDGHWEGELEQRPPTGQPLIVASRWLLRRDERGTMIVQADRDITEQKRAEASRAALRRARDEEVRRLGELAAMKADFTAMVVHEFFSPIAAIGRWADALALGGLRPDMYSAAILAIRREVALLTELTNDIRTTAMAERDDFAVHPKETPLRAIVEAAETFALTLPGEHPLRRETTVPGVTLVRADAVRIDQVLRNLLSNGAKYSPPGAPLALRATPTEGGRRVTLAVSDRGSGIHPSDLGRILEKFGRGRDLGGERPPGVGLGLYLSRRILLAHGSDLAVESVVGEGSTFAFTLEVVR